MEVTITQQSQVRWVGLIGGHDTNPFYFNDAGNQPLEGISQRHVTAGQNTRPDQDVGGSAAVGCVSGEALNLTFKKFYSFAQNSSYINPIWWGGSNR